MEDFMEEMEKYVVETRKEYEEDILKSGIPAYKFFTYEQYLNNCKMLGDYIPNSEEYK